MKASENEGSLFSRRSQNASTTINSNISIVTSNKFPFVFSLLDHITKFTTFPKIFSFIVAIFFYFQVIFSSTWPFISFYTEANSHNKIISKEVEIFWFLSPNITTKSSQNGLILNLVVFLICVLYLIFIGVFYHLRRKFIKWTLYPTRAIFEIISLVFLHPSAASAGYSLMLLIDNYKDGLLWIKFIVSFIVYFCFLFMFILGYSIMCSSSILICNIYTTFEPTYMLILTIVSSSMVFFTFLFNSFEFWVMNILQIIHFLAFLYIFWGLFRFHFHQLQGTILAFSILATSLILDFLMFILNIYTKVTQLLPIILSYSLFVVALITGHFLIKALFKKSVHKLKDNDDTTENSTIENFFRNLNIDSNSNEALKYLRIGLSSQAKCIIDLSLPKFIVSSHKDDVHVLCSVLQIVTFFPMNKQLGDVIFDLIIKQNKLKLWEKFTVYQSHRVKIQRQSSIPLESNEKMLHLRMSLRDCESIIDTLWATKVNPSVGIFETIYNMTNKTESLWQEGIRNYPNNIKMREDYCRFLIECKTDFKSAVQQKYLINMIENGANFSTDYAFKKFVLNYPQYLKKKIVNVHGHFIQKSGTNVDGTSTSSSSSSNSNRYRTISSSDDQIDFETETQLAKTLISQSKLRMSFYNSTKKSHLGLSKAMIVTAIISFIAALACYISTNVLLTNWIRKRSLDSSNSQTISNAFFNLNVAALDHIISFAVSTNRYPIS